MCNFSRACVYLQDTRPVMVNGKPLYDEQGELVEEPYCPRHEDIASLYQRQPYGNGEEEECAYQGNGVTDDQEEVPH